MTQIRQAYSRMGMALIVYLVLGDVIGMTLSALMPYLPAFMRNQLAFYGVIYGISLPVFLIFARWAVEKPSASEKSVRRRMTIGQFLMTFVMIMGVAYVFNYIGVIFNVWASQIRGKGPLEMNPVYSMMEHMDVWLMLYVGLIGPVVEEIIYRGVVLGRLKQFGQREAVIFSAVAFGLMHGNVTQTLYATVIGLFFGFITVRSGGIGYSCILHVMVNSYSVVLSEVLTVVYALEIPLVAALASQMTLVMMLLLVVAGWSFFFILWRRGSFRMSSGAEEMGVRNGSMAHAMFLNLGFILFGGMCLLSIASYVF